MSHCFLRSSRGISSTDWGFWCCDLALLEFIVEQLEPRGCKQSQSRALIRPRFLWKAPGRDGWNGGAVIVIWFNIFHNGWIIVQRAYACLWMRAYVYVGTRVFHGRKKESVREGWFVWARGLLDSETMNVSVCFCKKNICTSRKEGYDRLWACEGCYEPLSLSLWKITDEISLFPFETTMRLHAEQIETFTFQDTKVCNLIFQNGQAFKKKTQLRVNQNFKFWASDHFILYILYVKICKGYLNI